MARDVLADLWPSSYKGVPFYTERTTGDGGRRLAKHQFYGAEEPFIEDLGADLREWDVELYLVGDTYDADAEAVEAALTTAGAGTLVLPVKGPVTARLEKFKRNETLDRSGYIGFNAHFVREGAPFALFSSTYFAQAAYDGVAALARLAGAVLRPLDVIQRPSWVVADAAAGLQDAVATIEDIRAAATIDPAVSTALAGKLSTFYQSVPTLIDPVNGVATTTAPSLVDLAVGLADAMAPADAVAAFADAFDAVLDPDPVDPARSGNALIVAANAGAIATTSRLALLAAYAEGLIGATYDNRQAGIAARADCVERFDIAIAAAGGADGIDLLVALQDLRATIIDYLSSLITDLAPVVTVTSNIPLPSIVVAWDLYADPTRAADLIARNDVKHPSFMPLEIEALAPDAKLRLPIAA